jgi:Arc/MetJ family transcription regulator
VPTSPSPLGDVYRLDASYILTWMAKHLVDIDDEALGAARAELGTETIKETVNEALRRVSRGRRKRVSGAIDVLVRARLEDRDRAWR